MKRIYLLFLILFFCSCCNKKPDDSFARTYLNGISIIEEYGYHTCTDWGVEIDMETIGVFCDAADYMGALTGIKYHFTYVDIPVYESDMAVQQDIQYLQWWYEKYGRKLTNKDAADAIVHKYYKKYRCNPPNIDSVIARWDKIRERGRKI